MSRILLLEDDAVLSQTMQKALQSEGYDVIITKEGEEALKRATSEHFDLYLLDVNTPYMEGFDLLGQLRNNLDRTPAFFVTALNDLGALSQGYDTGIDGYLKKPFEVSDLIVLVKASISKQFDFLDYGTLNKRLKKPLISTYYNYIDRFSNYTTTTYFCDTISYIKYKDIL